MTVGDVLDDPARFAGETLADPIEGVADGRCKAKVMWDGVGLPFIHSFAHGHAVYRLRYDAAAVRARIAHAADRRCGRRTGQAGRHGRPQRGRDRRRWSTMRRSRAGVGVRAIKATLKAAAGAEQTQTGRGRARADAAGTHRPASDAGSAGCSMPSGCRCSARSTRSPAAVERVRRPRRDIDGTLMRERRMPIAHTHAFTTANDEGG